MAKRMFIMVASIVVFIAALGTFKYRQIQEAIAQGAAFQMPPEAVTTVVAAQAQWEGSLGVIGTVTAVHGVVVSADLPGVVSAIHFDSGERVRAGEILLELDTRQERAQLAAAEAQSELARLNLERGKSLRAKGVTSQAEFDRVDAEAKQSEARVDEIRATIARKTVRAPFAGELGIRGVNLGQYLNAGDAIVPLQALDPVYVDFSVPQQSAAEAAIGGEVRIVLDDGSEATGKITAVNSIIDEATRNVRVQATFVNRDGRLRPGMFVEARVMSGASKAVVALPASAISYAPYGDSVFIVEDIAGANGAKYRGVRQQFVKLGPARGDQVAVVHGVKPGEEIVTSGVFKLRPGAAVQVNNDVQPSNDPAPEPEDS